MKRNSSNSSKLNDHPKVLRTRRLSTNRQKSISSPRLKIQRVKCIAGCAPCVKRSRNSGVIRNLVSPETSAIFKALLSGEVAVIEFHNGDLQQKLFALIPKGEAGSKPHQTSHSARLPSDLEINRTLIPKSETHTFIASLNSEWPASLPPSASGRSNSQRISTGLTHSRSRGHFCGGGSNRIAISRTHGTQIYRFKGHPSGGSLADEKLRHL